MKVLVGAVFSSGWEVLRVLNGRGLLDNDHLIIEIVCGRAKGTFVRRQAFTIEKDLIYCLLGCNGSGKAFSRIWRGC